MFVHKYRRSDRSLLSEVVVNLCRLYSSVLFSEESLYWQGEGHRL